MPQDQYLSLDPNAGLNDDEYLSMDPSAGASPRQPMAQPAAASAGMMAASTPEDRQPTTGENVRNVLKWGGNVIAGMTGMGQAGRDAVENPKTTLAMAALPIVPFKKIPSGAAKLLGVSKERAGQNLQSVALKAKDAVVNAEGPGREGLRMLDLKAAGGRMPRAAEQFVRRVTDPSKPEITFSEARDFYSNLSRLSANEFNTLNPTMQRQVGAMREALHKALTDSAETVGMGGQYQSGMSEYARAAKAAGKLEDIKGAVTPGRIAKYGVGTGAGLMAMDKLLEALGRTAGSR
jgi:hypothetical protein